MAFLPNFPSGPLDVYREKASFDWKKLKIFISSQEIVEFELKLYAEIKNHPVFSQRRNGSPTFDDIRRLAVERMFAFHTMDTTSITRSNDLRKPAAIINALNAFDAAATIKYVVCFGMFPNSIRALGSSRHLHYISQALDGKIVGCYCLTEIGHGSNAKAARTTATYDKATEEFVLHTPDFQAAKCWAGSLGQNATHAVVFAQLITPDGTKHGLHAFVVKIRDPTNLLPYPGITVGDMGEKLGLNGVDNGVLMFNHYRIPRIDLLNKTGDVTEDGKYVTQYRNTRKRYGASLGELSNGRIAITNACAVYGIQAITIAIRYSAVRKQFGPENDEEVAILEYQTHQYRLLPNLAAIYALKIFSIYIMEIQYQFMVDSPDTNADFLAELGLEWHAVSSACKPVAGWTVRDAIQDCREACAGHGYLKASGIGDLRNDHDANLTYEGENHVLIQQTSNWLLKMWPLIVTGKSVSSPLHSVDFLSNCSQILTWKFMAETIQEVATPETILDTYQWLVCYLLKTSSEKYGNLIKNGTDPFWTKNKYQVFYAKNLSIAYIQHFILQRMYIKITESKEKEISHILTKLFSLYGVWSLEKHLVSFYQGGYMAGGKPATLIHDTILQLCSDLKDDAVALVDAVAPPDFLLKSVLGKSDGLVYKHLEASILPNADELVRPKWWEEIVHWKKYAQSKL